jgi:hypothetical protein
METAMSKQNATQAELKKFRRKLNRAIRQGEKGLGKDAGTLQAKNVARNELIQGLNHVLDTGTLNERVGARKAKKRLSVDWQNRTTGSLTGFWNQSEARA